MSSSANPLKWPASSAIDGDLTTICASEYPALTANAWLSIRVDPEARIDFVAVHNRKDSQQFQVLNCAASPPPSPHEH